MKKKLSVEFEEYWPLWPEGGQGEELTNVYVGCGFNHLVDLQWGSRSQFQAEVQKEAGFVDFQRTEWIDDIEDLPCLPGGFDWSVEPSGSQPGSGMLDYSSKIRKVRFDNGGGAAFLGQFFKTEEVQRCREYIPGERMVVEACVCTTAPFCEKFRVICRYITERIREDACRIKIEFYITYVKQVNPMTKVFMEKGARGGLTKNFEIYVQTLSSFISLLPPEAVDEIQDLVPLPSSSAIPSPENHGREHPPSCRQSTFIDWGKFASPSVRQALEPHVDRMKTSLTKNPAIPTFFSHDFSAPPVVHIACIIIFLVLVKVLLMSLRGIGSIMGLTDPTSTLVDLLFQVFDLPDSIGEVLAAAVVLEGAHWLINMLADIAKENHLDTSEPVKQTVAPFQNPIMSQSDFQEPPPSSSGSSRIVPDPKSPAKMSTPSSPRKSELIQEGASSLVEDGGLESAGEVGGEEKEPEAEFVEPPPSFIENTVSFFRLGMVATALAVDIAISGMKGKKPQNFSHKEQSNQDNEGGLLEENTEETPTTVLEEVFENERLQPFRVRVQ